MACLVSVLSLSYRSAQAQQEYTDYLSNSLLYSGSTLSGTARYQGIGGAQTALGGDMGSLSGNPAGLGMFKKSEFSISSALGYAGTSSVFIGNTSTDGKLNFNIPNIGIVFSGAKSDITPGKWRGGSFGISFSRQNSFQNQYTLDGINQVSSILDNFTQQANERGATVAQLRSEYDPATGNTYSSTPDAGSIAMYYNAYLVNPVYPSNNPQDTIGNQGGLYNNTYFQFEGPDGNSPRSYARQHKEFITTGAQNQWNISYGGNIDDRFYFGANLGITSLKYNYVSRFDENYFSDNAPHGKAFNGMTLNQEFNVSGTGVNLSVGTIYRANDVLRLGFSAVTPTFYNISQTYNSSVDVNPYNIPYLDYNGYPAQPNSGLTPPPTQPFTWATDPLTFSYKLRTPWRLTAGAAIFVGKKGFISADAEYVTYNQIKLSGGDATFGSDYAPLFKNQLQSVWNFKAGGELRLNMYRLRAGVNYQADPYQSTFANNLNRSRITLSLGGGVRLSNYYFDVAATYSQYKTANTPYTLPDPTLYPSAVITNRYTNVVVTFGTYF